MVTERCKRRQGFCETMMWTVFVKTDNNGKGRQCIHCCLYVGCHNDFVNEEVDNKRIGKRGMKLKRLWPVLFQKKVKLSLSGCILTKLAVEVLANRQMYWLWHIVGYGVAMCVHSIYRVI